MTSSSGTSSAQISSDSGNSGDSGGGEKGGGGSSGSSSSEGSSSGSGSGDEEENIKFTELITKNILDSDKEPNWDLLKSRIENLYSIWSTISIDLAEINVPEDTIYSFNDTLNQATLKIKEKSKTESIKELVNLYEKILTYFNSFDSQMSSNDVKIKEIKYNMIIAYENIENDNWDEAKIYVEAAQEKNNDILNNLENINEYTSKKLNIILNQIISSLNTKDKEIFYINYRNIIEELNLV